MSARTGDKIIPLPKNIELVPSMDALIIRRKWLTASAFFLLLFTLFWNGFMIFWFSIAISQGEGTMAAFGSLHAIVGLVLLYWTSALFVNKTDIKVSSYDLSVRHYPLPFPSMKQVPVADIEQLYCKEKVTRSENGTSVTYEVKVILKDQRSKKLVGNLSDSEQAHYIEKQIEDTLGIQDKGVAGEMRK